MADKYGSADGNVSSFQTGHPAQHALRLPVVTAKELNTGAWLPPAHTGREIGLADDAPTSTRALAASDIRSAYSYQDLQFAGAGA